MREDLRPSDESTGLDPPLVTTADAPRPQVEAEVLTEVGEGEQRAVARLRRGRSALGGPDDDRLRHDVYLRLFGDDHSRRIAGRYVLGERLGAGGGGVVFDAHDPDLDRKVAIKLLRPEHSDGAARQLMAARLLREARAASHVNHPNVVVIYDVGTHDDAVFLAMERLEGVDLRGWLAAERRSWPEIRDAFLAAARGLEAVHDAGLVHRDFKPSNVFMTTTGRVCLLDFGLSKPDAARPPADSQTDGWLRSELEPASYSGTLTQTGAVVGTPLYMAPEQHDGKAAGPAADQFAFCAAMFEALCGERAFYGPSAQELHMAKLEGVTAPVPRGRAPRAVWAVLRRGMRPDPAARWPDMASMRRALERVDRPRWRRPLGALVVAGALSVAGWLVLTEPSPGTPPTVTRAEAQPPVEDPERRAKHEAAQGRLAQASREASAGRFERAATLGAEARALAEEAGDPWLAVEAELVVASAHTELGSPLDAVAEYEAVFFRATELGDSRGAATAAANLVFIHGVALSRSGEALRWAEHARVHLERLDPGAQMISLEHNMGSALRHAGQLDAARQHLERAVDLAQRHGTSPSSLAKSQIELAATLHAIGDTERAHALAVVGLATLEHEHGSDDPILAMALQVVAMGYAEAEDWPQVVVVLGRSLAMLRRAEFDAMLPLAVNLLRLAGARARVGELEQAAAHVDEALALLEGPAVEPVTAAALRVDVAVVLLELGRHEEVVALLSSALPELESAGLAFRTVRVAGLERLASALTALGREAEAERWLSGAPALLADSVGDAPAAIAELEVRIALRWAMLGECERARAGLDLASPELSASLAAIQRVELRFARARCDPAGPSLEEARAALAEPLPPTPAAVDLHASIEAWIASHARRGAGLIDSGR